MKKVLATLAMARQAGMRRTARALSAPNTCKACGLGMGGMKGGMTNELGDFPSVCNKSVQAQSTDLQPPIPREVLAHSIAELRELDEAELMRLGRLNTPLYKAPGANRFELIDWDTAIARAQWSMNHTNPARSFFYASGRSSNEAGFVLQLLARLYGTNNVNNCSYYCHQATTEGLTDTVGTGTATVELADLDGCDLIFVLGANPASNHPRFMYALKACRDRGGEVVVINPARERGLVRFAAPKSAASMIAGGTRIASEYLQPRIGSDTTLLRGIAKALIARNGVDAAFVKAHTNGYAEYVMDLYGSSWQDIEDRTGIERSELERIADKYVNAKNVVFAWGMGLTHHTHGVANVQQVANLALLRGMVGRRHAGLLPLRGHSNVQGIGTIGVKPVLARDVMQRIEQHLDVRLPTGPGLDTMAAMQAAHAGAMDFAAMVGGNLLSANPNFHWAIEALNRIRFKLFLTTTLNRSHLFGSDDGEALVLPVTARDEEPQATTQESMFNYVRLSAGGIERLDNVRSETAILCALAKGVRNTQTFDFARFEQHDTVRSAIAASVPGMEQLADIEVARREFHVKGRLLHRPEFATPDGKASFVVADVQAPLPDARTQFVMATVRSEGQFNSLVYEQADVYRGTGHRRVVMMHPDDMAAHGLAAGQRVTLASAHGRMRDVEVVGFDVKRGGVLTYYPEANVLTGTDVDPASRTPGFKSTPIWLEPGSHQPRRAPRRGSR